MDGPGYGEEEEPLHTILGKVQNNGFILCLVKFFSFILFHSYNSLKGKQ
jgi:hypothetical protein